jgi:DNA repair protein RecO (recombination protein O)
LVAEVADRVCEDRHPALEVYQLAAAALSRLAEWGDSRRAASWFCARALDVLGYAPQLNTCAACAQTLQAVPTPFMPDAGGFLCSSCARPGMMPVSVSAVKVLRVMAAADEVLYRRLKLDERLLAEVELVLEAQLEHHLDRQLRSLRFLRHMRATC